jgi:hypothetical protein
VFFRDLLIAEMSLGHNEKSIALMRHIIQVYLSRSDAVSRLNFLRIDSTDMSSEPEALI